MRVPATKDETSMNWLCDFTTCFVATCEEEEEEMDVVGSAGIAFA